MARTLVPLAHSKAISSRSAKERPRFFSKGADGARCVGGIPPELRNQRVPTGAETPASTAASSLDSPSATARQNRHRFSRCQTGGLPGEFNLSRVERSHFRLPVLVIYTSINGVLRRPVESAQYTSRDWAAFLRAHNIEHSMSRRGNCHDNARVHCPRTNGGQRLA